MAEKGESIQKLLDSLEKKPDERVAIKALIGRALSRSDKNLHLAVSGGIVAVPIANIENIVSVTESQADVVRVIVRNPQEIRTLLRARLSQPASGGVILGGVGMGNVETARDGDTVPGNRDYTVNLGVGTCNYTDTDTITGGQGQPDACDGSEATECHADDVFE
jgi:hypothetical protein